MKSFVLVLIFLCARRTLSIPILSLDDTKLDSIVISEIDLPTESSVVIIDQEISKEPESSFHDLIEKYDENFIKNIKDDVNVHKRSSNDEESLEIDAGGKSIIEKIQISDPDVRKEFENELSQNQNQIIQEEEEPTTENSENVITDYDPNYASKMIVLSDTIENATKLTVHEKEILQVHLVEQIIHQAENESTFTTIVPDESFSHHEVIKNPEVVEVMEHIVFETDSELKLHEHTTVNSIVEVKLDIDPIEIIPKDRHRLGRDEDVDKSTDANDKFAGFDGIPTKDLTPPGEETTEPDSFFKENAEEEEESVVDTLRETLEYVAIYGKSLDIEPTTVEPVTEIVEVNTKITVDEIQVGKEIELEGKSSEEESSQQSLPNKSSEEHSVASVKKYTDDSSEENVGKETFVEESKGDLRSLEFPTVTQRPNVLPEDIFKSVPCHEIKKKDHPTLPLENAERKIDIEEVAEENSLIVTVTALYETFEEITTTVSDGLKLTNDFKHNVQSFREHSEENKIVLDTHNEAISSKNSKIPLVGVNEMMLMTLKEQPIKDEKENIELALAVIPYIGIGTAVILIGFFKLIRRRTSQIAYY
ncbi:hypothetical protein PVAND_003504 [Polypedilum vanderplanki]|uniref:Uncharacterized protein n=1 Tax=Polypedilum vanderplanki TaxID=319348 RepID=A0A9J6BVA4_POLVA|nr:hypothetical protein PVAND_003504 [Polypedilum vanderplanki]